MQKKNANKNKQNKKKQRQPTGATRSTGAIIPSSRPMSKVCMSKCAYNFAKAIANPRLPEAAEACIPMFCTSNTYKFRIRSRYTCIIGANGYGFFAHAPCVANNSTSVWYTGPSYVSGSGQIDTTATGVIPLALDQLPFTTDQVLSSFTENDTNLGRMVTTTAYAKYTGTLLNRGGAVYGLVSPNHNSINQLSTQSFSQYPEGYYAVENGQEHRLTAFPIADHECMFHEDATTNATNQSDPQIYPYSSNQAATSGSSIGAPMMGYIFKGTAGQSYDVELWTIVEYRGPIAQHSGTPTMPDPGGTQQVITAAMRTQAKTSDGASKAWAQFWKTLRSVVSATAPLVPILLAG